MKSNYLLVISFFIFGTIKGMSYWEQAKSYFRTPPSLTPELRDLQSQLKHSTFRVAFSLFERLYSQANPQEKKAIKEVVVNIVAQEGPSWNDQDKDYFKRAFLQPALELEPTLFNDIFNKVSQTYFNHVYPHDFQLILSKNIDAFSQDVLATFLKKQNGSVIPVNLENVRKILLKNKAIRGALNFLIRISTSDDEEAKKQWLQLYFFNFDQIPHQDVGQFTSALIELIGYDAFIKYLAQHIDSILLKQNTALIKMFDVLYIIERTGNTSKPDLMQKITEQRKKISAAITKNIMHFNNNPEITKLLDNRSSLLLADISIPDVVKVALSHMKELSPEFAKFLLFKTQDQTLAQAIISQNRFPGPLIILAKDVLDENSNSPTRLHLKRYKELITDSDEFNNFHENKDLNNLYIQFRVKEEQLNKDAFYTFVHGQMRRFYFPEKLYTHLWGLRKKQPVDNFFFAHVKDLVETPHAQFEEDILRKTIHMAGSATESEKPQIDLARRKKVLFMNYAFFANAQNLGSNSANYVLSNENSTMGSQVQISIKEPFLLLGYDWVYQKHKKEIEQLAQDFINLSSYGNMLLIAVPKDKIYKYVYLCKSGGLQKPLKKKDGTQITDVRIAMETLLKNPEHIVDSDQIEFCLIMTQIKGGLDPSSGIQIYPLLSGDPEKLKALQAREKILLDKITADVKVHEIQQRAAKVAGHVVDSAQAK